MLRHACCYGSLFFLFLIGAPAWGAVPDQPWWPKSPPLDPPAGQVIRVASVDELFQAAERIAPGGTILLEDVRDNVFVGIQGRTGEGRGAVFLWNESRDCLVERNVVIDCDSGICLGNYYRAEGTRWHARGCLVRNNFVVRCEENGILAARTRDCRIVHNTIHNPTSRLGRLIWVLEDNDGLLVANNLLDGPDVLVTASGTITQHDNLSGDQWGDYFVDARGGNLRLVKDLPVHCRRLAHARADIDRHPLPETSYPGAHQLLDARAREQTATSPSADNAESSAAPPWVDGMKGVHAGFGGTRGYVAQLGDSVTY